jgi:hypothetical protein
VTETAEPGRCGLCGTASMFLVTSPWGQVHKHCLSAKSQAARRGASIAVPSQEVRDEALLEEGRQQERAAVQKELEAVARVLSRRDEPGSSIVAALLDWIQSRNEEGG